MDKPFRQKTLIAVTLLIVPAVVSAAIVDDLVGTLAGDNEPARSEARKALVREDPATAVHKLLPVLASDKDPVWWAANNTIADIINATAVAGREAEHLAVAKELMALIAPEQPRAMKLRGLRLLAIAAPKGFDLSPVVAMLDDADLRERARAALQEMGTPEARTALREALPKADADFQCALLNALGTLKDCPSLEAMRKLTASDNAKVRAAAVCALSYRGEPNDIAAAKRVLGSADDATRAEALDGYLRLVNAVVEHGGNWEVAVGEYREMLTSDNNLTVESGLAGLGRIGDGSCVAAVLDVAKNAKDRTWLMAIDALRNMQGIDVVRALVEAYPTADAKLKLALLPVLGNKRHALVGPVLAEAANSSNPAMRIAALEALSEALVSESNAILQKYATSGSDEEKAVARKGLLNLADGQRARNQLKEAGAAYVAVYNLAGDADKDARKRAIEGIAACPVAEGYDAAKVVATDKDARSLAIRMLVGVAGALVEAKQNEKALELYNMVTAMSPGADVIQAVAKGMHAAGAKVDLQGLMGIVSNWWVVGPFDLGEKNAGWNVDYVNEAEVNLVGRYMTGKRRVQWTPLVSNDASGKIDLRKTVADTDNAIGYAYTEITVNEPTDAVLLLGVDDSEKVWVNGNKVYEKWVARGLTPDQDKVPVKLQAGVNKILLKIWQNSLGWEFCMRVTLPDGRPLQFTQKKE